MENRTLNDGEPFPSGRPCHGPVKRANKLLHRRSKPRTEFVRKTLLDHEKLSKRAQRRLAASTRDSLEQDVAYSLHKQARWQLVQEPEAFLSAVSGNAPAAVADLHPNDQSSAFYAEKKTGASEVKCVRVASGNGAALTALRDSVLADGKRTEEGRNRTPTVLFVFESAPATVIEKDKNCAIRKRVKNISFCNDDDEITDENDDDLPLIENETFTNAPNPRRNLTLGDFIQPNRRSVESRQSTVCSDFELLDLDSVKSFRTSESVSTDNEGNCEPSSSSTTPIASPDSVSISAVPLAKCVAMPIPSQYTFHEKRILATPERTSKIYRDILDAMEALSPAALHYVGSRKVGFEITHAVADRICQIGAVLCAELAPGDSFVRLTVNTSFPVSLKSLEMALSDVDGEGVSLVERVHALVLTAFMEFQGQCHESQREQSHNPLVTHAVTPVSDHQLLTALANSDQEWLDAPATATADAACFTCHLTVHENAVFLPCGHIFCRQCLQKALSAQTLEHTPYLTCPECRICVGVWNVLDLVPLPFVRELLKAQIGERTSECPRCSGSFAFPDGTSVRAVKCTHCQIAFCVKCRREPHFPLTCAQFTEYWEQIKESYNHAIASVPTHVAGECECGGRLMAPRSAEVETQSDSNSDPTEVRRVLSSHCWCDRCPQRYIHRIHEYRDRWETVEFRKTSPAHALPKEFRLLCLNARQCRLNKWKLSCAKGEINSMPLRRSIYYLIEFCAAWLALTKSQKDEKWRAVHRIVLELRTNLDLIDSLTSKGEQRLALQKASRVRVLINTCMKLFK